MVEVAQNFKKRYDDLSSGFFDNNKELDIGIKSKKKSTYQVIHQYLMKFLKVLAVSIIIKAYIDVLGTEKSQQVKYKASLIYKYDYSDLPRLLPVHQFISIDTQALKSRLSCLIYKDPLSCLSLEQSKCNFLDLRSEQYELCMIRLDTLDFCSTHYRNSSLWTDTLSPSYLQYYLRLHNCYDLSGVPRGQQYCRDYYAHEDSWSREDLYNCYISYGVEFGKEYCDHKFGQDEKELLM